MNLLGLILVGGGLFSLAGAVFDWDWFMESRKARFFVALLGRTGARGAYILLGIVLIVMGILAMLGIIQDGG